MHYLQKVWRLHERMVRPRRTSLEKTNRRRIARAHQGGQKQVSGSGDDDSPDGCLGGKNRQERNDDNLLPDQMGSLSSLSDRGKQYVALLQAWKPSLGHQDSGDLQRVTN